MDTLDIDHLDAVTTLAAINWAVLSTPDTCPRIRAATAKLDEGLEALQDAYAPDLVAVEEPGRP